MQPTKVDGFVSGFFGLGLGRRFDWCSFLVPSCEEVVVLATILVGMARVPNSKRLLTYAVRPVPISRGLGCATFAGIGVARARRAARRGNPVAKPTPGSKAPCVWYRMNTRDDMRVDSPSSSPLTSHASQRRFSDQIDETIAEEEESSLGFQGFPIMHQHEHSFTRCLGAMRATCSTCLALGLHAQMRHSHLRALILDTLMRVGKRDRHNVSPLCDWILCYLFFWKVSGFVAGFVVIVLCLSRRTVLHTLLARLFSALFEFCTSHLK